MKTRMVWQARGFPMLLAAMLLIPAAVSTAEEPPDWSQAQRDVAAVLLQPQATLAALVKQVGRSVPQDGHAALFKLCVLTRAGIGKGSIDALRDLKRIRPELTGNQMSQVYYDACDKLLAWNLAAAFVDIFADSISDLSLDNRLLQHFQTSGWPVERIDQWLAAKPPGTQNFWIKERLRFNLQNGRGAALLDELADRVRAAPQNVAGAKSFLDVMVAARAQEATATDVAWIAEIVKPELATDASEMASYLVALRAPQSAIVFYRQAIARELTAAEVQRLAMMTQRASTESALRAGFAAQVREGLAECLLETGRADEAQKWMVEAANIREKNGLGRNASFAGRVQAASRQTAIEQRIKAEETLSEKDPGYWQERAAYYRGRKEPAQEEAALQQGLALAQPQPEGQRHGKGAADWRSSFIGAYAQFLARENRAEDAVALLRKELAESPALSSSCTRAAQCLAFDFDKHIGVDDEVLWTWLENRPHWEYAAERLLWRMLEHANRDDLDRYFTRAEKLAFEGDPARASSLGWIENRMAYAQRSLPLLKHAVDKAQDAQLKERASFTLFESYLDLGDWKNAEAILPDCSGHLTPREFTDRMSQIAVCAAQGGAKADAMRVWNRAANLDLTATGGIPQLVAAGLRDDLVAFYEGVQKAIPSSDIPEKVLESLRGL